MKFSIIIPAYEAKGRAIQFMTELLNSIRNQTYKNFEIIIPDHSQNNEIEMLCHSYSDMNIKHFYNERGRGNSSVNMNEGIKVASGDVIKIIHMDDVMFNPDTLRLIFDEFEKNKSSNWGAVGFNHNYESENEIRRTIIPSMEGVIGCPSVSFFKIDSENLILFDENLIIINDKDIHERLYKKYGEPIIVNDICITIRMHENQVSNLISSEKEKQEREYLKNKNE
jgi:glycosyltransferase involved in cell wall biosynthesis